MGYRTAEGTSTVQADIGEENIFIGHWTAGSSRGAYRNIGMGYRSLRASQPGSEYNVGIGHEALGGNVIGEYNIALGEKSQYQNDNGHNNISIGQKAMYEAGNDGHAILDNISIGRESTRFLENGDHNIVMGYQTFTTAVSGSYNILLGANAADAYVLYEDSVIIGAGAEANATGETNQIVIGHDAIGKGSNTVTIGDDNVTDIYMSEDVGATLHTGTVSGSATSTGSFGAIQSAGNITPKVDDTSNLGSAALRFSNVFTTDLQLSNEGKPEGNEVDGTTGSWTIQEGEDNLYLLNRKNGKKYKFKLEEIG